MATKKQSNAVSQLNNAGTLTNVPELHKRLEPMLFWFMDTMNDVKTHRFYYEHNPVQHFSTHQTSPIRDTAAAWITSKMLNYFQLNHQFNNISQSKINSLSTTIKHTIRHYVQFIKYYAPNEQNHNQNIKDCAYICSKSIAEVSTIAHSAFLILSLLSAHVYNHHIVDEKTLNKTVPYLVNGILNNQNRTCSKDKSYGAFKVDFEGDRYGFYRGIELYPAEAMLALLSYHQYLSLYSATGSTIVDIDIQRKQSEIIHSVNIAFRFYSTYFYNGNIDARYSIFYSNWQSQLYALLLDILQLKLLNEKTQTEENNGRREMKRIVKYVLDLQHLISTSEFMRNLNKNGKHYSKLSTVEVACGLESLCDGLKIALQFQNAASVNEICKGIKNAVIFLNYIQRRTNNGGFGHAVHVKQQRIDVTGHVANAYMKLIHILKSK